jgi:GNAT superfamily N-acetyltransferase
MITVDLASSEERPGIVAITLDAYAEYESASVEGFWERYCDNIRKSILEDSSATIFVAREEDKIKGSVLYCQPNKGAIESPYPEMRLLAVPAEFRNRGIAGLLIDACEQHAIKDGVLTLHTTELMKTAMAMYERRGYIHYPAIDFQPVAGFVVRGYKKILRAPLPTLGEKK